MAEQLAPGAKAPDFSATAVGVGYGAGETVNLSDFKGRAVVKAYGVWVEKSMYGEKYMGAERSTFVTRPGSRWPGGTLSGPMTAIKIFP